LVNPLETPVDRITRHIAGRPGVVATMALVAAYALIAASPLHDQAAAALVSNLLIAAVAGLVAYVFWRAAVRGATFPRLAAVFVGLGAGAWSIGQALTFALHLTRGGVTFPSIADIALLFAPLFGLLGVMAVIPRTMPALARMRGFLDGIIITGSTFSIVWILVLDEAVHTLPPLQFGILLYYPVMDMLLFASMLAFYPQMVQERGRPWALVVMGFACLGASNVWFTYAAFKGIPTGASWGETIWVVAACLLAVGGARLVTKPAVLKPVALRPRELLVPFLPTAIGIVIGIAEIATTKSLQLEVLVAGMVLILAFMARQIIWSIENYRMTRQALESKERIQGLASKVAAEHESLVRKHNELVAAERLSRVGSWSWEPESGRFHTSEGLRALFGGAAFSSFDGFMGIVSEDDLPRLSSSIDLALSGELAVEFEFQTRGPTPSPFRGILKSQRLDPNVPRLVCLVQDATDQKKADEAAHAAEESQVEVSRLQAVDEFKTNLLRTASHELNTPLGVLRLQLYVLGKELESHGLQNLHAFRILDRNVERLATLVKDMLDVARLQSGRLQMLMQPTDVRALMNEMYDSFRPLAERENLFLSVEAPVNLKATMDPRRMTQVLYNFLTNAIKFTPPGGRIKLRAESIDGKVRLSVADTGVGLRQDQIARLFQAFSQVHDVKAPNAAPGTGLGLYISRAIIEQHGGHVWAESAGPGRGARFCAEVPLEVSAEKAASETAPIAASPLTA
jgi:signal transduction histidine kinase